MPDTDTARVSDIHVFGWPMSITLTSAGGAGSGNNWEDPNVSRNEHVAAFLELTFPESCAQLATNESRMDTGFHVANEGGDQPVGYVPSSGGVPLGASGVTIGIGVDLGQRNLADLQRLQLSGPLRNILTPYLGLQGASAQAYLTAHPLTLSPTARYALNLAVHTEIYSNIALSFNSASSLDFFRLPGAIQTVIADVGIQYGPNLGARAPTFWSHVVNGRWQDAVNELRNFGDLYTTRRNAEADILQAAIDSGEIPPSC